MLNLEVHPSGKPDVERLVLVHGFTQNAQVWGRLTKELSNSFEVVCVDLPGHGQTDTKYDSSDLWESAQFLVDTCGPAYYVGYSLGARVVLHALVRNPEAVKKAVLIGPKAGFRDPTEREARTRADNMLADRIESLGDDRLYEFIDDWLAQPFNDALTPKAKARDERLLNRADGLAASLRNTGSGVQDPLWDQLPGVDTPVLVIKAEEELPSVEADVQDMVDAMGPNAELAIAPDRGHAGVFESPDVYARMIEAFCR